MIRQAVILAGGKATRLQSRLNGMLKALVQIDGVPLLERQLKILHREGFRNIVILAADAIAQIEEFKRSFTSPDMNIHIFRDPKTLGTAGALLQARDWLDDNFLVIYGDLLFDVSLDDFFRFHMTSNADVTVLVHPNDHPHDSDLVEIDEGGWICNFHRLAAAESAVLPNRVNAAIYAVRRTCIAGMECPIMPLDFARDLFPVMLKQEMRFRACLTHEYIKDIGTPSRLDQAVLHARLGMPERSRKCNPQRAVFFDYDCLFSATGAGKPGGTALRTGVETAIRFLNGSGYRAAALVGGSGAEHQSNAAESLQIALNELEMDLGRSGAYFDYIFRYGRKAGILADACVELNADRARSWLVQNSAAGAIAVVSLENWCSRAFVAGEPNASEFIFNGVTEAVEFIARRDRGFQ